MDDRQILVSHIESLWVTLRDDPENPEAEQVRIALELGFQMLACLDRGEVAPAHLQARVYRAETDHGDHEYAKKHRALLHRRVAEGDELAAKVLELLSDDPFWRQP